MRGDFELTDLEAGLVRAEKFQLDQERRNASAHAMAVAHAGSDQTRAGGGVRGRDGQGRRSGKRYDNGEGFNDWGGRGYDDFVPGEVTKTAPSGD